MQANSSVKLKGRPPPKTAAPPVVPPDLQSQFLNQVAGKIVGAGAGPGDDSDDDDGGEGGGEEEEDITLPPRRPLPSLVSDSPADVYIGYLANGDEAVARKLAASEPTLI